jgi:hypothetical protein
VPVWSRVVETGQDHQHDTHRLVTRGVARRLVLGQGVGRTYATARSTQSHRDALYGLRRRRGCCPLHYWIGKPRSRRVCSLVWWSGYEPSSHAPDECRSPCLSGGIRVNTGNASALTDRPISLLEAIIPGAQGECSFDPRYARSTFYGDSEPETIAAITPPPPSHGSGRCRNGGNSGRTSHDPLDVRRVLSRRSRPS